MDTADDAGRIAALQAALDDAQARAFAAEVRATQLEAQLQESAAQGVPGRQEAARRDRETLRLKSELEAAQQSIADLRDQQTQGEQKALELSGELARRDSQLKGLQAKLDQALQEKRRLEQALHSARAGAGAVEQLDQVQQQLVAAQRDLELNRAHAEGAERQLSGLRERAEGAEAELAELRARADEGAVQKGELEALQGRVTELEAEARKHEDRVTRLYARLKAEERAREKARKAVAVTAQLLAEPRPTPSEPEASGEPPGDDEPAVAEG
jgi:chromosome segregation ATPase